MAGKTLEHVNVEALRASGLAGFSGNFFTVDLSSVGHAFEEAPWVRRAQVRRIWPDRSWSRSRSIVRSPGGATAAS